MENLFDNNLFDPDASADFIGQSRISSSRVPNATRTMRETPESLLQRNVSGEKLLKSNPVSRNMSSGRKVKTQVDRANELYDFFGDTLKTASIPAGSVARRAPPSAKAKAELEKYRASRPKLSPEEIVSRQKAAAQKRAEARKAILARESDEERAIRLRNEAKARNLRFEAKLLSAPNDQARKELIEKKARQEALAASKARTRRTMLTPEQKEAQKKKREEYNERPEVKQRRAERYQEQKRALEVGRQVLASRQIISDVRQI